MRSARLAPPPRAQKADKRVVDGRRSRHVGLRVQDPGQHGPEPPRPHRVRAAVLGQADARHEGQAGPHRQDRSACNAPQFFFAQDRALADEAYAGDVVGIPNHGTLRIGDTLTEGEDLNFVGVPSFAPEILRRVRLPDAMKAKKLKQALQQLAEEGVVQVFRPADGSPALVGVVGPLQLDVLRVRLNDEYGLEVNWDTRRVPAGALDRGRRSARCSTRFVDGQPLGDRRGSRRRPGLPGAQPVQSRLHRRAHARHRVHGREGRPQDDRVTPEIRVRGAQGITLGRAPAREFRVGTTGTRPRGR